MLTGLKRGGGDLGADGVFLAGALVGETVGDAGGDLAGVWGGDGICSMAGDAALSVVVVVFFFLGFFFFFFLAALGVTSSSSTSSTVAFWLFEISGSTVKPGNISGESVSTSNDANYLPLALVRIGSEGGTSSFG